MLLVVAACAGNNPNTGGSGGEVLCRAATSFCTGPGQILYWFFQGPPGVTAPTPGQWTLTSSQCLTADQVPTAAVPAFTLADFRRLPLPPARVELQPGNGRTLINIPTNVIAHAPPTTLTTTLLGRPVRVRATAIHYHWTFGDGTTLDTTDPGAPYPDLRTTHTYTRPGTHTITLTTTYTGQYSLTGGPWLPITGTAQVTSTPTTITAIEVRAELVPNTT